MLFEEIKKIPQKELYGFAISYLATHTFVNCKKLAIYYLLEGNKSTLHRTDFNELKKAISFRFRYILNKFIETEKIVKYGPHLYKKVDIIKPKQPDLKFQKGIPISFGPKLIYDGISFKNPRNGF